MIKKVCLRTWVFPRLKDDTLNELIRAGINQPLGGLEKIDDKLKFLFDDVDKGIPQGNPLSPLFSNIFLNEFDDTLKKSPFRLVRYADDFIVMCKSKDHAKSALNLCKDVLENKLNLELHPEGSKKGPKIFKISKSKPLTFLSITFDGNKVYPSRLTVDNLISKLREIALQKPKEKGLQFILFKIKWILDGWVSAYFYTRVEMVSKEIDWRINNFLYRSAKDLEWNIIKKTTSSLPRKLMIKKEDPTCISPKQRKYSGVPIVMDLVCDKRDKDKKKRR